MKNSILYFAILIAYASSAFGQTGINTKNPKGVLHVDASKDNNAEGDPTDDQRTNDVIVDITGKVGIGTIVPTAKLDIRSSTIGGAIRIADGSQGAGKILTSDENGMGRWTTFRSPVLGTFPSPVVSVPLGTSSALKYSGIYIELSPGKWIVNIGLTFSNVPANVWQKAHLSTSNSTLQHTNLNFLGPAGVNTAYAGNLSNSTNLGYVTGSSVVEVINTTTKIYIMLVDNSIGSYMFKSDYLENFLYALPIN